MNRIARLAGTLAAASLGLAAPSFAQMYGPQGGPNGPGMSRGYGRPSGANVDQSLASLHSRLSVRPDQESAWEGFANAVRQQKQIDALSAGLQKVSALLELNKAAPRTVLNNQ